MAATAMASVIFTVFNHPDHFIKRNFLYDQLFGFIRLGFPLLRVRAPDK